MTEYKHYESKTLEIDLIHDLRLNHDISINDLLAYIIWFQRLHHQNEYEKIFVLDGKKYKVSIKELDNED
jgi:hypothetical protein